MESKIKKMRCERNRIIDYLDTCNRRHIPVKNERILIVRASYLLERMIFGV